MKFNGFYLVSIIFIVSCSTSFSEQKQKHSQLPSPHQTIFVHPDGNDQSSNTLAVPFATIQRAINIAQPGDTVILQAGAYSQDARSVRDGKPGSPIRIVGMPGSIIHGNGNTSIIELKHSYIELSNLTIDGLFSTANGSDNYRKKLIYVKAAKNKRVMGVKLQYLDVKNALDECVRIKYQAQNNEVAYSRISNCGIQDYRFDKGKKKHNGEGIYIGTAPEQIKEGKNPTNEVDQSNHNWIHHNLIETFGGECVDIKEGSSFNIIEFNTCRYEKDNNVGGISIRGNYNIVRFNHVAKNIGAGIRLGGDTQSDGINNVVYGNYLSDNQNGGMKIMRGPQGKVCNNSIITLNNQKSIRVDKNMDKTDFSGPCTK